MFNHGFDHELEEEPGGVEHGFPTRSGRVFLADELERKLFVDVAGVPTLIWKKREMYFLYSKMILHGSFSLVLLHFFFK